MKWLHNTILTNTGDNKMRTKQEIMHGFYNPKLDKASDSALSVYMVALLLEVHIDIRDSIIETKKTLNGIYDALTCIAGKG